MIPPVFAPESWTPSGRPSTLHAELAVDSRPVSVDPASFEAPEVGPLVLEHGPGTVRLRFLHHAPQAGAVALAAAGWWFPDPVNACDLTRIGDTGWWGIELTAPADWRVSYRFLEHHEAGDPPWWTEGLRTRRAVTVGDRLNPRTQDAARVGASSVLDLVARDSTAPGIGHPGPGGALPGHPGSDDRRGSVSLEEGTRSGDPYRSRWWTPSRSSDAAAPSASAARVLPLLVLTDGEALVDRLGVPDLLAEAVARGELPEVAVVFLDVGPDRDAALGEPSGQGEWIGSVLVPRLLAEGLGGVRISPRAYERIVWGSSYGGLTALFAVAAHPEAVGAAVAQSPSVWRFPDAPWDGLFTADPGRECTKSEAASGDEPGTRDASSVDGVPPRLLIQVGRFEGSQPEAVEALARTFADSGAEVDVELVSGGHDWAWWIPEAMRGFARLLAP